MDSGVDKSGITRAFRAGHRNGPRLLRRLFRSGHNLSTGIGGFPLPAEFRSLCDKAFESAQRALSLDGADYEAHVAIAWPYLYRKEYDQAKKHLGRAIKLNPNNADTLANATLIFAFLGEPEEGIKCGESALQLNPRPPTGI